MMVIYPTNKAYISFSCHERNRRHFSLGYRMQRIYGGRLIVRRKPAKPIEAPMIQVVRFNFYSRMVPNRTPIRVQWRSLHSKASEIVFFLSTGMFAVSVRFGEVGVVVLQHLVLVAMTKLTRKGVAPLTAVRVQRRRVPLRPCASLRPDDSLDSGSWPSPCRW